MTAQTPTYGLTYTTGTDRLCDGADILAQLEADYAAAFATIEADVDRLTVLSYAVVSANNLTDNGVTFDGTNLVVLYDVRYDAVDADTANMVDLGTAPAVIFWNPSTNQTGVWMGGFATRYTSNHLTYNVTRVLDDNNSFTQTDARIGNSMLPTATPQANTLSMNGLYPLVTAASSAAMLTQFVPLYDGVAGGHIEAVQPHMWFFWMRDPA